MVASKDGSPKKPVYVCRRWHLACEDHALIIAEKGDFVIYADHHRKDFCIEVCRIQEFSNEPKLIAGKYKGSLDKKAFGETTKEMQVFTGDPPFYTNYYIPFENSDTCIRISPF